MADICIAYASANPDVVGRLYELLSAQWDVWWDDKIVGRFAEAIEREIPQSKCLVPIWSTDSRESDMVRDELELAKRHHVEIIPARIDRSNPPFGFGGYTTVDLEAWNGETDHPGFRQLLRKLSSVVTPRAKPSRPLTIGGGRISLPALFLSVSSFETRLSPREAIKALRVFGSPVVLISAYDTWPERRPKVPRPPLLS